MKPQDIARKLIDLQLKSDRIRESSLKKLQDAIQATIHAAQIQLEISDDLRTDLIDVIADAFDVPKDTTEDEAFDGRPDGYCRDWLWWSWANVVRGTMTVEEFIAEMEASKDNLHIPPTE